MASCATIKMPQKMSISSIEPALRDFHHAVIEGKCSEVVLDFSHTEKIYPDGIVPFLVQLDSYTGKYKVVPSVVFPKDKDLRSVGEINNWFYHLDSSSGKEYHWENQKAFPLIRFNNADELNVHVRKAVEIVSSKADFNPGIKRAFHWALNEIAGNIVDHSGKQYGWIQVTTYEKQKEIHFVVGDSGVGIPESIRQRYKNLQDDEAIIKSMEKGVTRDPKIGQGYGLAGTLAIVEACKGRLEIYSQKGLVKKYPATERLSQKKMNTQLLGTVVEFSIRYDAPVDLAKVIIGAEVIHWDETRHTDNSGDIVIKLIEKESNFGNRPTGEKLRHYLFNFINESPGSAIMVDMDGVESITSSFADELFGKLVTQLGFIKFNQVIRFRNVDSISGNIIEEAIQRRMMQKLNGN